MSEAATAIRHRALVSRGRSSPSRASLGDEHDAVSTEGRALAFDDAVESRSATGDQAPTNAHAEPCNASLSRASSRDGSTRRAVGSRTAEEVGLDLADHPASELDVAAAGALVGLLKLLAAQTQRCRRPRPRPRPRRTHRLGHGQRGHIAQRVHVRKSRLEVSVVHGTHPSTASPELSTAAGTRWTGIPTKRSYETVPPLSSRLACCAGRARPRAAWARTRSVALVKRIEDARKAPRDRDGSGHRADYTDLRISSDSPFDEVVVQKKRASNGAVGT